MRASSGESSCFSLELLDSKTGACTDAEAFGVWSRGAPGGAASILCSLAMDSNRSSPSLLMRLKGRVDAEEEGARHTRKEREKMGESFMVDVDGDCECRFDAFETISSWKLCWKQFVEKVHMLPL